MSDAKSRLSGLLGHFVGSQPAPKINFHTLSPTFFLPRAAAIEPEVSIPLSILSGSSSFLQELMIVGNGCSPYHQGWQGASQVVR